MARLLLVLFALAAGPACAFDFEKWVDGLASRQMEAWKKERIQTLARDPDPDKRLEALEGLSYNDDDGIVAIAGALGDADARVRRAAASKLWSAEKRAEPYRAELVKRLDDADANVVAYAAGALQAIGMKEVELAPARRRVLAAPEASVSARFLVARNLVGHEAPAKLVAPMVAYLEENARGDRSRNNVELAEKALARLARVSKDRSLIDPLWEALVEARNGQVQLMRALAQYDPRPEGWTRMLVRQLDNPQPRVRYEALAQMRSVKREQDVVEWVPHAARMLADPEASVRSNALWALAAAQGLAAAEVERIAALASSDPDPAVRRNAVRALGEIAEANQPLPAATRAKIAAAARPAVDKALRDEDKEMRDAGGDALRRMGTEAAVAAAPAAAPTAAAPAAHGGNEAAALAFLRARKVKLDEQSWFVALQRLDVPLVHAFLDAGMSPNKDVSELGPPMRVMLFASPACSPGVRPTSQEAKDIIKLLLERGAEIQAADRNGNTAITEAAGKGCDRETIRMLIKAGAKIHATNASGLTPFEMGLWSGHDGLEEFIAAGYRLPPDKVKLYLEGYKDRPAAVTMVRKAAARK